MPATQQKSYSSPEIEGLTFEPDQEVTVETVRAIVAPQNTLDFVEETRLRMVGDHVTELLRGNLPPQEASVHTASIYNLGAEAILEYLPVGKPV
jgi:hypothetical protein